MHGLLTGNDKSDPKIACDNGQSLKLEVLRYFQRCGATVEEDQRTAPGATGSAVLGLVDAVLAPEGTRLDPALASVAARAGRAVIGPDRAGETWERLAAAGRAARLDSLTPAEATGPPAASVPGCG